MTSLEGLLQNVKVGEPLLLDAQWLAKNVQIRGFSQICSTPGEVAVVFDQICAVFGEPTTAAVRAQMNDVSVWITVVGRYTQEAAWVETPKPVKPATWPKSYNLYNLSESCHRADSTGLLSLLLPERSEVCLEVLKRRAGSESCSFTGLFFDSPKEP